jgi:hypothetical protein
MPAAPDMFLQYVGNALNRAMGEWGRDFIDQDDPISTDRNGRDLGVVIYKAVSVSLSLQLLKVDGAPSTLERKNGVAGHQQDPPSSMWYGKSLRPCTRGVDLMGIVA